MVSMKVVPVERVLSVQQMLVQITISILYGAYLALPVVFGGLVFLDDIHRLQLCVSFVAAALGVLSASWLYVLWQAADLVGRSCCQAGSECWQSILTDPGMQWVGFVQVALITFGLCYFCMCCKWTAVLAMKASSRLDDLKSSVDVIAGRDSPDAAADSERLPSSRLSSSAFSTPRQLSARHQLSASSKGQLPSPDDAEAIVRTPKEIDNNVGVQVSLPVSNEPLSGRSKSPGRSKRDVPPLHMPTRSSDLRMKSGRSKERELSGFKSARDVVDEHMLVHRVSAHTRSCGTQTVYRTVLDAKLETQVSSQKTKDPPIARAIPVVGAPVLAAAPPPAPTPLSIDGKYQRQNLDAKGMVGTPEMSRSPADGTTRPYLEATTQTFLTGANPFSGSHPPRTWHAPQKVTRDVAVQYKKPSSRPQEVPKLDAAQALVMRAKVDVGVQTFIKADKPAVDAKAAAGAIVKAKERIDSSCGPGPWHWVPSVASVGQPTGGLVASDAARLDAPGSWLMPSTRDDLLSGRGSGRLPRVTLVFYNARASYTPSSTPRRSRLTSWGQKSADEMEPRYYAPLPGTIQFYVKVRTHASPTMTGPTQKCLQRATGYGSKRTIIWPTASLDFEAVVGKESFALERSRVLELEVCVPGDARGINPTLEETTHSINLETVRFRQMLDDGTTRISIPLTTKPRQGLESIIASLAPDQAPGLLTDRSNASSGAIGAGSGASDVSGGCHGCGGSAPAVPTAPAVSPLGLTGNATQTATGVSRETSPRRGGGEHDATPPMSPFVAQAATPGAVQPPHVHVAPPSVLPLPLPLPAPGTLLEGGLSADPAAASIRRASRSVGGASAYPAAHVRLHPELQQGQVSGDAHVVVRLAVEFLGL